MSLPAHRIVAAGRKQDLLARAGTRSMRAALNTDVDGIAADCGGCPTCATCHLWVYDASPPLQPPSASQVMMLETDVDERLPASRPGCRIVPTLALDSPRALLPAASY